MYRRQELDGPIVLEARYDTFSSCFPVWNKNALSYPHKQWKQQGRQQASMRIEEHGAKIKKGSKVQKKKVHGQLVRCKAKIHTHEEQLEFTEEIDELDDTLDGMFWTEKRTVRIRIQRDNLKLDGLTQDITENRHPPKNITSEPVEFVKEVDEFDDTLDGKYWRR